MNDKRRNASPARRLFIVWLILFALIFLATWVFPKTSFPLTHSASFPITPMFFSAIVATIFSGLWLLARWAFGSWQRMRRLLVSVAVAVTVIAIFYTVENWRGKRAWENYKRDAEAKGQSVDWNAYIPAPVPDEQNFFKAPMMAEWFVRPGGSWFVGKSSNSIVPPTLPTNRIPLVELVFDSTEKGASNELNSGDDSLGKILREKILRLLGTNLYTAQDFTLLAVPVLDQQPEKLFFNPREPLRRNQILKMLADEKLLPVKRISRQIQIEQTTSNSFEFYLSSSVSASDYVKLSAPLTNDLEQIREAVKRPFARMEGDYQQPFDIPIPNFIMIRTVSQIAAQRAQSYLLLGEPDKALRELSLIPELSRMLEGRPHGKPMTLVAAMINVAINGLYLSVIRDGFELNVWREPELSALQKQLSGVDLSPITFNSFQMERASVTHFIATASRSQTAKVMGLSRNFWEMLTDPQILFINLAPHGWFHQNAITVAKIEQKPLDYFNTKQKVILPAKFDELSNEVNRLESSRSPLKILARMAVPNFKRAIQRMAQIQTAVNEAQIVCALERYKSIHGRYPDSLELLVPGFIEKLPHDLIGGGPLKYRATNDKDFLLYSVGWNETDDGGEISLTDKGAHDLNHGDWVWPLLLK